VSAATCCHTPKFTGTWDKGCWNILLPAFFEPGSLYTSMRSNLSGVLAVAVPAAAAVERELCCRHLGEQVLDAPCACLQGDITAGKMIFGVEGVDPDRRRQLVQLLDVDLYQRLTTMSDGQRRRVQICMGLLKPYDVSAVAAACSMLLRSLHSLQ